MWKRIGRILFVPWTIANRLGRIALLMEENNDLLRELHVTLTGRQASAVRIGRVSAAPTNPSKGAGQRIRSANDAWHYKPLSALEESARRLEERENRARQTKNVPERSRFSKTSDEPPGDVGA